VALVKAAESDALLASARISASEWIWALYLRSLSE
jgi:hypothetical protein